MKRYVREFGNDVLSLIDNEEEKTKMSEYINKICLSYDKGYITGIESVREILRMCYKVR